MALWDLSPKITILARHTTKRPYFSGEHLFFRVKGGTGALRMEMSRDPACADPMLDTYQTLTLNGTPLALIQASGCPTCQSLLAAGHGLPVDCPQLRQAADAIAAPFDHLEEALERLCPRCRTRALEERCAACGTPAGEWGEGAASTAFDPARFEALKGGRADA